MRHKPQSNHSTKKSVSTRHSTVPKPRTGGRSARVVTEVLTATLEVFAEQGYAGLSIDDVAQRAGVNKTTVYRRWPTKAELVGAAVFSLRDKEAPPPDTGDLRRDLLEIVTRLAEVMVTPRRRALMHAFLLGNAEPELQALLTRLRQERPAIPHVVFERAFARGELPAGSDTQLIAAALIGPIHSRASWKREQLDGAFLRALVELVIAGATAGGAVPK